MNSLPEHFLDNQCQIISGLSLRYFIQVHEYRDKRSLPVGRHQSDNLILNHLYTLNDLVPDTHFSDLVDRFIIGIFSQTFKFAANITAELLTAGLHKWCQVGQGNTLTTVLRTCNLCDDLCGDVTCGRKTVRLFDHGFADNSSVLQHILQIDQTAIVHVLCEIVCIMEMNNTFPMSICNIMGQQKAGRNVLADFARHVITLYTVDNRILIGIFLLDFFIFEIQQT